MGFITKKQAVANFRSDLLPHLNESDRPAVRMAWNDYVDGLVKSGQARPGTDWVQPDFVSKGDGQPKVRTRTKVEPTDIGHEDGSPQIINMRTAASGNRIKHMRDILENGYKKIEGKLVDAFSASAYVQIYDALNPENQSKIEAMPLTKAMNVVWKLVEKYRK